MNAQIPRQRIRGWSWLATIFCASLIVPTLLTACGEDTADNPRIAVDDFLSNTVIGSNGTEACRYLTPSQQRAVSRAAHDVDCAQALDEDRPAVGGEWIASQAQLQAVPSKTVVRGGQARVWLVTGTHTVVFDLVNADRAEDDEFAPPDTAWRISGGALEALR